VELAAEGQPTVVRFVVIDTSGARHAIVDKLPIFSVADTLPAADASLDCSVLGVRVDAAGRRVITIDISCPWGCETEDGRTQLEVFEHQLAPSDDVWISLAGARVSPSRIGTNDGLNYGRQVDDALVYQAVLPITQLDWYAAEFAQMVDELREDDERYGDTSRFAAIEYRRTLAEAAALPEALAEAIMGMCDRELLAHHFPFDARSCELVINSTDAVVVVAGQIIIRGRCFGRRRGAIGPA
jgi:hypothetical protein